MGTAAQILKVFLFAASLFLGAGFFATSAHAQNALRIDSISGVSNYTIDSATNGAAIYAGIAGTCSSASTTDTCNSCLGGLTACNAKRVHPNLVLNITFTVTGELTGVARLHYSSSASATVSNVTGATASSGTNTISKTVNPTVTMSVSWGSLCTSLSTDGGCTTVEKQGKLYICVSADATCDSNERVEIPTYLYAPESTDVDPIDCSGTGPISDNGICGFTAFPGDEKITVTDLDLGGSYPTNNDVPVTKMVVLFSDVNFADIDNTNYVDGNVAELDADSNGDISPDTVEGLTNDVKYFFRSGMIDAAQNLYFITSDNEITTNGGGGCGAEDDATCNYIATPSKVYGLLTEDLNCFITTAAYGSSFAPKVMDFRAFRNKFLVPSALGRKIIYFYYDIGPKAARWLDQNEWAKPAVRLGLLPAWLFVETAQFLGLTAAAVFFVSFFILLFCGVKIIKRRMTI
ncbi:MAG: CFI-box-CTERM domain-containing protein [Bdellovibrionota bacterium]